MSELIITEKPSAAIKIAQALADDKVEKKSNKKVPYYEITHKGKNIIIACAVGHLYNLTEKEKSWTKYPAFDLEWKPSNEISKYSAYIKPYLDTIKLLSKQATSYVIATDFDTEGETIGYNILRFICNKEDAKRMKFSTLTKEDLEESYEHILPHIDKRLAEAGLTRHYMDYYWGISSSRALTNSIKVAKGGFKILSSGRVQSPTLALLAHKEEEITKFKPEPFWQLLADIKLHSQDVQAEHKHGNFTKKEEAEEIHKKCKNHKAIIAEISKKKSTLYPPYPFNISTLQTESYKLFGFSPKQTLDIAQSLYTDAYISYPRTSSEKLPPTINYKKIMFALAREFKDEVAFLFSRELRPNEGQKTDSAHIAIYPTHSVPKDISKLSDQERKIYTLIVRRFLACFGDPATRESVQVVFEINKEPFIAEGITTLEKGWIKLYEPYAKFKEVSLPILKEQESYDIKKLTLKEDKTKPPSRYSQASILNEMEKLGLGTKATRANILQILYDRNYIVEKSIQVTTLGMNMVKVLDKYCPELVDVQLTNNFEADLEKIEEGKNTMEHTLDSARKEVTKIMNHFRENEMKIGKELSEANKETMIEESYVGKCPNCGKDLRIKYSPRFKSRFVACSGYPECKTTYSLPFGLPKPTKDFCKECNFPLVTVIRQGKRPFNYCINKQCPQKERWRAEQDKLKKEAEKAPKKEKKPRVSKKKTKK